jgi:serine protease
MRGWAGVAMAVGMLACAPAATAAPTGRILVSLTDARAAQAVMADAGVVAAGKAVPQIAMVPVRPAPIVPASVALHRLRSDRRVRAAQLEDRSTLRYMPSDPALLAAEPDGGAPDGAPLQWALERQGFPRAWSMTHGAGAVVAVIDTGIDGQHPDLAGKIDGAFDADETTEEPPTVDTDGHGTHVASLACADTDNDFGIAGAGFDCRLLVIKSDLTDGSVAAGIVAAADAGAHALNMSFGDDGAHPSQAIADAVDYAVARDVVLVAAAADEPIDEQGEPASLLQPTGSGGDLGAGRGLSVTAADAEDRRAAFAGRGSQVSLAAYGALHADAEGARGLFGLYPGATTAREQPSVIPPDPGCGCRADFEGDDRYAFLAGTSMAAPQVAAAAALMRDLNPDLSAAEVVRLLKETARGDGWDPELGWGILDAGAAVDAARRIDRTPPASRAYAAGRARRGTVLLRWRGADRAPAGLVASGVARYDVYRAIGRARPRRVFTTTTATRRRLRVPAGRSVSFFTVAVDRAGNREPLPRRPDVRVSW